MRCCYCDNWIPDNAHFCQICGRKFVEESQTRTQPRSKSLGMAAAVVFVLFVLVAILVLIVKQQADRSGEQNLSTTVNRAADKVVAAVQSRKLERSQLVSQPLEIPPLMNRSITFNIPAGAINPRIEGWFRAAGGSGNDIEMTVRKSGPKGPIVYASGRVSVRESLNIPLEAGQYCIVFNNSFSLLSSKVVSGDMQAVLEHY